MWAGKTLCDNPETRVIIFNEMTRKAEYMSESKFHDELKDHYTAIHYDWDVEAGIRYASGHIFAFVAIIVSLSPSCLFALEQQRRLVFDPDERLGVDRKERHYGWPDWKIFDLAKPQPRGLKALEWYEMDWDERKAWLEKKRADGQEALDETGVPYVFVEEPVKSAFPDNWASLFVLTTSGQGEK